MVTRITNVTSLDNQQQLAPHRPPGFFRLRHVPDYVALDRFFLITADMALDRSAKKSQDHPKNDYAPPRRQHEPKQLTKEELAERAAAKERYGRGEGVNVKSVKDRKLRGNLKKMEFSYKEAAMQAKDAELLLPQDAGFIETEGMERTFKLTQDEIVKEVDVATAQKVNLQWQCNSASWVAAKGCASVLNSSSLILVLITWITQGPDGTFYLVGERDM